MCMHVNELTCFALYLSSLDRIGSILALCVNVRLWMGVRAADDMIH